MLTTIEATFENGQIIWNEPPPGQTKRKVLITFLEDAAGPISQRRKAGSLKGKISVPDDFNEPLEDLKDYM
ncbi:MAG: DUF2281 domain-containing protein [Bacteroidetes bacterium]|nr:DUF2281 domain-containing protein [Fibrella sp.]